MITVKDCSFLFCWYTYIVLLYIITFNHKNKIDVGEGPH